MTKIDNTLIQAGRYLAYNDKDLIEEERKSIFYSLKEIKYYTIEEEWAFRNGFFTRKNYGQEFIRLLHNKCILICNYKCQGNQKGIYAVEYNSDLGDEEEPIINYFIEQFNLKTTDERNAFRKGFIARRKFGTRYLNIQNKDYIMVKVYEHNEN